jgi:hypothetical protein
LALGIDFLALLSQRLQLILVPLPCPLHPPWSDFLAGGNIIGYGFHPFLVSPLSLLYRVV